MIEIREEQPGDWPAVRDMSRQAFGRAEEADVIERLRQRCPGLVSLVAWLDGHLIGHIWFNPVILEGPLGFEARLTPHEPVGGRAVLPHRPNIRAERQLSPTGFMESCLHGADSERNQDAWSVRGRALSKGV